MSANTGPEPTNISVTRVALVTGGTAGIGAAIAEALHAAGYRVAVNFGSHAAAADKFATRTGLPVYSWNVADFDACADGVARVQAAMGPIDVLVNNAGITRDMMLHKMTLAQWREVIDTDLGSCFNMCRAVIEGMRERHFGRIINISSVHEDWPMPGNTPYCLSKGGMRMLTRTAGVELAPHNILVVGVGPGAVSTPINSVTMHDEALLKKLDASIPLGRVAKPEEIANVVAFLASEGASYLTATTVFADGGIMQSSPGL